MAPQRLPRFSEEELRVMVEEIIRVEPQLFGSQAQQTSIARKMELWRIIVDRVNAVGQHPRTRDDNRKRWNDLWGKVCSVAARHQIAVQRTGGGPPPPPPQLTTWEEQVLAIMHPEGLAGVGGGPYSGTPGHPTNTERSGTWGQWQGAHSPGTEAQDNREAGRTAVRQGEDRPREPSLQEALTVILGAYQHSQDTLDQILDKLQESMRLQEGQYLGIMEDLKDINSTLVTIAGVLADMSNTMREAEAHHWAPTTSQTDEQPSTSAAASGQAAPPQDQQATSTPPLAEGEPPRKRSLRSRQKPDTIAKTATRK
ncbi:hypothetical protein NDU88_003336 [Pleurodeles waltl]|uniref:Myb/SANT-like DNA-binding domain-containing protein n=1 Tax=Pleurodeles waltl TaxID=8319 RepID=A0AAV7MVB6_PLEWA|nr:hypothetical protein NDU88_003336 [Pleurodeles waltl]